MLARMYKSTDAAACDHLLGFNRAGDVRLDSDEVIVVGDDPKGILVFRPGAFVHEFRTGERDLGMKARADAMLNFAIARATSREYRLRSAIFSVDADNIRMQHYVEQIGAVRQDSQLVYTLTP